MLAVEARIYGTIKPDVFRLITIVSHEMSATGAPKMVWEITKACLAEGWGVIVVSPEEGPFATILVNEGALVVISDKALWDISPALDFARFSELMICNTIVSINVAKTCHATPVAWFLHETGLIDAYLAQRADTAQVLASVAAVWTSSPMIKKRVAALRSDAVVVGACVEQVESLPRELAASALQVIVLGSLEPRKGQDLLVQAYRSLSELARSAVKITFYGNELDADFARDWHRSIIGDPNLVFGGALLPQDAIAVIAACDAVIIPSRDEPLSLVAIEAMSAGKLVICTRAAGIAEYLIDGESGYVAATASPSDLADALARALDNSAQWLAMGQAGRSVYENYFTPTVFNATIIKQVERLIHAHE